MPTRIHFEFFGDTQIDRTLEGIEIRGRDATPAWEEIAESFLAGERSQFASQGAWGSGGWSPLSPKYAEWKARHYPGQPILVRTGALRASLTDGPDVRIIRPQDAWLGSMVRYGRYHQSGDGVPRRPPVDIPESERRTWAKIMHRFLIHGAT